MDAGINRARSAQVEQLETRRLFSGFASLGDDGIITVRGTPRADRIGVRRVEQSVVVTLNRVDMAFPRSGVEQIHVRAAGGNDVIESKRETLTTVMFGEAGNDTLVGGSGNDQLNGGSGDDLLRDGPPVPDTIAASYTFDGGGGMDTIDFSATTHHRSVFDLNINSDFANTGLHGIAGNLVVPRPFYRIVLTPGDDQVMSNLTEPVLFDPSPDFTVLLELGDGNDQCNTSFSADEKFRLHVLGGNGDDEIGISSRAFQLVDAGPGNDTIFDGGKFSEPRGAEFTGGPGRDTVRAAFPPFDFEGETPERADFFLPWGVENASLVNNGVARTRIFGNGLKNRIEVSTELGLGTSIYGRGGDDTLIGSGGRDVLDGAGGNDSLIGHGGNDTLRGGEGNDTLVGARGRDRMFGNAGDDLILARDGRRDTLYGGDGTDAAEVDQGPDVFDLVGQVESLR
jgi:Ca2+-binding RTX toxin-like protein